MSTHCLGLEYSAVIKFCSTFALLVHVYKDVQCIKLPSFVFMYLSIRNYSYACCGLSTRTFSNFPWFPVSPQSASSFFSAANLFWACMSCGAYENLFVSSEPSDIIIISSPINFRFILMSSQYSVFLITPTSVSLVCGHHICGGLKKNVTTQRQIMIIERDPSNVVPVSSFLNLCIYFQLLIRSEKYEDCYFVSL